MVDTSQVYQTSEKPKPKIAKADPSPGITFDRQDYTDLKYALRTTISAYRKASKRFPNAQDQLQRWQLLLERLETMT